jgi:ABC transporter substrate binding protein
VDRQTFLSGLTLGMLRAAVAAEAQQAGKVQKIGLLLPGSPNDAGSRRPQQVFADALRKRGWIEGQAIVLERRWADGRHERFPEFAAKLIRLNADLIVTWVSAAALAAQKATKTIPIVMVQVTDPVQLGLVKRPSALRPGLPGGRMPCAQSLYRCRTARPAVSGDPSTRTRRRTWWPLDSPY